MNKDEQARIIEIEDAALDSELSPERLAAKQGRLRKREVRAREAEAKKAKQAEETYTSIEQYWQANRSKLTSEERQALEAREAYVLELEEVMREYIAGTDGTTEQDLADTIEEVKADISANGLCNSTVLVLPRIWSEQEADLRSHFSKPTLDLVTYGFYTAVTERAFEDFRNKFLTPRTTNPTAHGEMMICSSCKSLDSSRWVLESDKGYVCHRCLDAEHRSCATAKEALYDAQGRMKPRFWRGAKV